MVGASYDFGVVKLTGQYNQAKGQTSLPRPLPEDKEFNVGASVPIGAFCYCWWLQPFAKSDATNNNNKGTGVSLLGTYALSKRTNLYTGFLVTRG